MYVRMYVRTCACVYGHVITCIHTYVLCACIPTFTGESISSQFVICRAWAEVGSYRVLANMWTTTGSINTLVQIYSKQCGRPLELNICMYVRMCCSEMVPYYVDTHVRICILYLHKWIHLVRVGSHEDTNTHRSLPCCYKCVNNGYFHHRTHWYLFTALAEEKNSKITDS